LSRRWPEHARAEFHVGKQVDQLYLRMRIGQGAMACVFLAEDMTRRCKVAGRYDEGRGHKAAIEVTVFQGGIRRAACGALARRVG
jgi:hypothetical protein